MKLPRPTERYDAQDQTAMRSLVEQSDSMNYKRNQDVEIAQGRLILKSPDGTRYVISVSNAGAISATAL